MQSYTLPTPHMDILHVKLNTIINTCIYCTQQMIHTTQCSLHLQFEQVADPGLALSVHQILTLGEAAGGG